MDEEMHRFLEARLQAIETRINGLEKQTTIMVGNIQQSTLLAANTLEKRLEGMNEFRDQLKDQASRFVTRDEVKLQLDAIQSSLRELRTFKDQMEGKASQRSVYVAWSLAAVGLIVSALGIGIALVSLFSGGA